ncbi:metallophosphoesterase [Methylobacterium sp. Leaf456]|uniref:metallophosphoesterase family protein n=1 Tax=Methylobacterium sp. Leaf456 TaxID=1736382 RepID=UPI0006F594E5|nr:metallophosphoesterase [Methylobacterium sp. Leaf456]KQT58513.1 metallophosphoesterase [Methylobacterium sp. Leaf456]
MNGTDGAGEAHAPFVFAHIGDLHLEEPHDPNAADLRTALNEIAGLHANGLIDFAYLPGDLAEHGRAAQYDILERALTAHPRLPVRLIAGDHDRQHGTMHDFDRFFATVAGSRRGGGHEAKHNRLPRPVNREKIAQYYYAETIAGVRCLFLDMVSAGYGQEGFGLDFRLGPDQRDWLTRKLAKAVRKGQPVAVFAHTYPDDLSDPEERAELAGLIRGSSVRLVEMGHTHYNELAHDGRTLYAAARSVGQNEDGSVGYAVAAIDGDVVSWRFKPLDRALPFVMITSPADRRLATAPLPDGKVAVRALVLSNAPQSAWRCHLRIDGGPPLPMEPDRPRTVLARIDWPAGARRLAVTVTDGTTNPRKNGAAHTDTDTIEPVGMDFVPAPVSERPGSDALRLPFWPEKGLRGDQLGPNRVGRHW